MHAVIKFFRMTFCQSSERLPMRAHNAALVQFGLGLRLGRSALPPRDNQEIGRISAQKTAEEPDSYIIEMIGNPPTWMGSEDDYLKNGKCNGHIGQSAQFSLEHRSLPTPQSAS